MSENQSKRKSSNTPPAPAFLKGGEFLAGPVYRASGPLTVQRSHSPFSGGIGSKSPAPLQFTNSPHWGEALPQAIQPKKLGSAFTAPRSFTSPEVYPEVSLQKLNITVSQPDTLFDTDNDEAAESPDADQSLHTIVFHSAVSDSSEVLRSLSMVFERSIHYDLDFKTRKIQGVAHDKSERCKFVVQLFPSTTDGLHTAEFTRRSGSQFLFSRIVTQSAEGLSRSCSFSDVTRPAEHARLLSGGEAAKEWEGSSVLDEESCKSLVEMCRSEFEDVQREALSSVATLVSSPKTNEQFHHACGKALIEVLASPGRSKDEDVQWFSAYIMAQMCVVPAFAEVALPLVPLLFMLVAQAPAMQSRATKVKAALALQRITRSVEQGPLLRQVAPFLDQYLDVLERHYDDPDPELRACIRQTVQQLSGN